MKNYAVRKIITPATFPLNNNAVTSWSEQFSSLFKAQLVLYSAVGTDSNPYMSLHGKRNNHLLKAAMSKLLNLGNSLHQAHSVKYLLESGAHWRNLVKQMRDEHTDLLVAGMPPANKAISGQHYVLMYNSPCPTLFVPEDLTPAVFKKILVPVRLKDGLEQKLPVVITWAKTCGARVCLSAFASNDTGSREKAQLYHLHEKMTNTLSSAGIEVETETAHGFHFGTSMVQRARQTGSDLIAIAIEPSNFVSRLFTKMVGPYFLENSPVPVLAIPLMKPSISSIHTPSNAASTPLKASGLAVASV